jgi:hypothetical protein
LRLVHRIAGKQSNNQTGNRKHWIPKSMLFMLAWDYAMRATGRRKPPETGGTWLP